MATKNKTSLKVYGYGVTILYKFLTEKQFKKYKTGKPSSDFLSAIYDECNLLAAHGVLVDQMKLILDDKLQLDDIEEINEQFPITLFPEKRLIPFTSKKQYALVSVSYEKGEWIDESLLIENDNLVFEQRIFDFNTDHEYVLLTAKYNDEDIEQRDVILIDEQYFLMTDKFEAFKIGDSVDNKNEN